MPLGVKPMVRRLSLVALGMLGGVAAPAIAQLTTQPFAQQQQQPNLLTDELMGKEPTEGVYVRDSAGAVEKLTLADKMGRLKQWNNSADLYQELIGKYNDRVVPSKADRENKIYQYTSIVFTVQERLAKWPQEGLDVYRARYEVPAATLLENAAPDDAATLNKVYSTYFVTDAGKQAAVRLIDLYMEDGEFPAAAWIGDRLLSLHPNLGADRPSVLYRTSLAHYFAGDEASAKARLETMRQQFLGERGIVRGKDVVLAEALAQDIQSPRASASSSGSDAWPMLGGDPSRGRLAAASGTPGARLYGIALSKAIYPNSSSGNKQAIDQRLKGYDEAGMTLGIMPVTERGELYFQDGQRVYGVSLESGVPLPGWAQTYPEGSYALNGVYGSQRMEELCVTLTDHEVLAIMGQPDRLAIVSGNGVAGEPKLVCLDRLSGKEKWVATLSQIPGLSEAERALHLAGSPLVVGDGILVFGSAAKQAGFEDSYVLCFDLNTGKFRWSTYIASANSMGVTWGAMAPSMSDNTSHLAYANGRVYVQTNLGALAALDAYSGGIVWLDIYPTERQPPEPMPFRGRFGGPFNNGNIPSALANQPPRRPWTYNPIIVQDDRVFMMPIDCKYVLVYDAGTGMEIKRIDLQEIDRKWRDKNSGSDNLENIDTLLGVSGERLVLAGKSGVICMKWKDYEARKFDPLDVASVFWVQSLPHYIRGRGFLTSQWLFVPAADRLYRIDVRTGKSVDAYPHAQQGWEEPEGPGNVIATADHVIIAGAGTVNVYTDLAVARTKLDKEVAGAPGDARPHLRYAEVMLAAGESDLAIDKLDEAIKLLGGSNAMQAGSIRDRVFTDALTFAQKLAADDNNEARARATKLFDRAAAAASSSTQQVHYRLARAKFAEANHRPEEALALYQQVLADPAMRPIPMVDKESGAPGQAAALAEASIDTLIKSHPGIYESIQKAAADALHTAQFAAADSAPKLIEVARTYPNSTVAAPAMLAAADAYESANNPRQAIQVLRQMWFKYPDSPQRSRMLESMARNYFALPGRGEPAIAALARASVLLGDPKLLKPLKLPDSTLINSGTPVAAALDQVRRIRSQEPIKGLAEFNVPVPPTPEERAAGKKRVSPFLAQSPQTTIDNIRALILPLRDFARLDRVAAWTTDGRVVVYPAGGNTPLLSSDAMKEEPRNCAWEGDSLLVWGATQMLRFGPDGSQLTWRVDVKALSNLEVAKLGGDAPVTLRPPSGDVVINGQGQVVVLQPFNGRRRGAARFAVAPPNPLFNPPPPQRTVGSAIEQIVEVHPVSDVILVSTSSGRLLAIDLANGHTAWQVRLTDRPLDRIVANDDFTVVRLADDTAVRLAAIDTATGEIRSSKSFGSPNGNVPVNMALAPDGTLVYTLTDKLCLQDLYKPWTSDSEKELASAPGLPPYQGATEPDQLLVADGRILALADSGEQKYVNLYSLETGQPIHLRYTAAGEEKETDRRLTAGKSWNATLRLVGPRLYVIGQGMVAYYNLDHPDQYWPNSGQIPLINVEEVSVGQKYLAVIESEPARAAIGPQARAAPAPSPQSGPASTCVLYLFRRLPVSATNPNESGLMDYQYRLTDPAGILPTWQAVNGGFYYVTADSKLHMLKGAAE